MMVGRLLSFSDGIFSGAMLNFQGGSVSHYAKFLFQHVEWPGELMLASYPWQHPVRTGSHCGGHRA